MSHQAVMQKQMIPEAIFKRQVVVALVNVRGLILSLCMLLFVEYTYWTVGFFCEILGKERKTSGS